MKYAREHRNQLVYPTTADFIGIPNWQSNEPAMRRKRWLPLVGDPEPREGYTPVPATWHTVNQSETRTEPRNEDPVTKEPFIEIDPETGEARQVTREVPVEFDTSYIQIDGWNYVPIPVPEPVLPRQFSKGDLLEALIECNLYDQAKAIYASDMDLQIAWAGFADIDMDYPAAQGIMAQYPELFSAENVLRLQQYIAEHTNI